MKVKEWGCADCVLPLKRSSLSEKSDAIELPLQSLYPQLLGSVQAVEDDSSPPADHGGLQILRETGARNSEKIELRHHLQPEWATPDNTTILCLGKAISCSQRQMIHNRHTKPQS